MSRHYSDEELNSYIRDNSIINFKFRILVPLDLIDYFPTNRLEVYIQKYTVYIPFDRLEQIIFFYLPAGLAVIQIHLPASISTCPETTLEYRILHVHNP